MNGGSRRRRHGSLGLSLALPPNLAHQMIDPTDHNSDAARGGAGCGRGGTGAGRRRRRGGMRPRATGRECCCHWRAAVVLTVALVRDVSVGGIARVQHGVLELLARALALLVRLAPPLGVPRPQALQFVLHRVQAFDRFLQREDSTCRRGTCVKRSVSVTVCGRLAGAA